MGKIWATNYYDGTVSRIDPTLNGGIGAVDFTTVNLGGNLYNYSDMTGSTLRAPPNNGTWAVVHDTEETESASSLKISWTEETPADSALDVAIACSADSVIFGPESAVNNGQSYDVLDCRYVKVISSFTRATTGESPVLFDLTIESLPPCAILGESSVFIGQRSTLSEGHDGDKPNVCSNGSLRVQARVTVNDEGFVKAFARNGELTQIGAQSTLSDSVYTNADLTLLANALVEGDAHAQGDVLLRANATVVGDCQVGGSLGLTVGASCGAVTTNPESVAEFTLPECLVSAPGGGDIATIPDAAYELAPGDYGDVDFAARNSVTLTGGDYTFKSLRFGPDSQVKIQAATKMQVENRLSINSGVVMTLNGLTAKDVKLFVNGGMTVDPQAKVGDHTELYGTICGGPESVISIGQNSYLNGGLFGNEISVGAGVEFVASPASLP
jgi:predicted acyltransferase (DUF342 family)